MKALLRKLSATKPVKKVGPIGSKQVYFPILPQEKAFFGPVPYNHLVELQPALAFILNLFNISAYERLCIIISSARTGRGRNFRNRKKSLF